MFTVSGLLELHQRCHKNLAALLKHCSELTAEELDREIDGFGYPSVRLQFHHEIGAQRYWIGVLKGQMNVDEDDDQYPTIDRLVDFQKEMLEFTENYLKECSDAELGVKTSFKTWGDKEVELVPAHVFFRCFTHYYHHQGQILAMCRLMGKPANGFDFPLL